MWGGEGVCGGEGCANIIVRENCRNAYRKLGRQNVVRHHKRLPVKKLPAQSMSTHQQKRNNRSRHGNQKGLCFWQTRVGKHNSKST